MKKSIPVIAVILSYVSLIGCSSAPKATVQENLSHSVIENPTKTSSVAVEVVNAGAEKKSLSGNSKSNESQTLSNGKWTITLSSTDSWNGVNGTGDVSYQGCDINGKCLQLTGGKIYCRDGTCSISWKNGNYVYIVENSITEERNPTYTLIVLKDNTEILNSPGLKVVGSVPPLR